MKAALHDVYGDASVVTLRDVAVPDPAAGEVLIRVRAAGLDRGVWHLLTGTPLIARLALGIRTPRRKVLGLDVAGVVERVGAGVTEFAPGDRVFGGGTGTFAEFAIAKPKALAPMPVGLSFEQAAASSVSGLTALQALRLAAPVAGKSVLIIGAGSGVGSFAIQLAKAQGARVTAVVSAGKIEFVRRLGADHAAVVVAVAWAVGALGMLLLGFFVTGPLSAALTWIALTPLGTAVLAVWTDLHASARVTR